MAKLNDFISNVKKSGLAKTNRYLIRMPTDIAGDERLVSMYCDQIQLPSSNIATQPHRTWGETREMPTERLYENINISVYVDGDMKVKQYFDNWINLIQNKNMRTYNYYINYVKDIDIIVQSISLNDDKDIYGIKLVECYPKTISAIQLDYAAKDIMKLNVTFTYRYWRKLEDVNSSYVADTMLNYSNIRPEITSTFTGATTGYTVIPTQ